MLTTALLLASNAFSTVVSTDANRTVDVIKDSQQQSHSLPSYYAVGLSNLTLAYADADLNKGAESKQATEPENTKINSGLWNEQVHRIVFYHNHGVKMVILMRGLPGSGKSYMAKRLLNILKGNTFDDYKTHIFSTDDYFVNGEVYQFDKFKLPEAHEWNRIRVTSSLRQGLTPVIVDNTNIELWEMEPYARAAVTNGYIIEVVETYTPWAKNISQLSLRNTHNVPISTTTKMLENYKDDINGAFLLSFYNISYPVDMLPPVMKTFDIPSNDYTEVDVFNQTAAMNTSDHITEMKIPA